MQSAANAGRGNIGVRQPGPGELAVEQLVSMKSHATIDLQEKRAFHCAKSDLRVQPIQVCTEEHDRDQLSPHILVHYVEWHLRRRLVPMLFQEDDNCEVARE